MKPVICHLTTVHPRYDVRIFQKECKSLAQDYTVHLIVADDLANEVNQSVSIHSIGKFTSRFGRFWKSRKKVISLIREINPIIVHFHDPELLLLAPQIKRLGCSVIYDVHEDLPKQILSKHWIPKVLRKSLSKMSSWVEHYMLRYVDGVIGATALITERLNQTKFSQTIYNYPILDNSKNREKIDWDNRLDKIAYVGSISRTRGIVSLVESLSISNLPLMLAGKFSENDLAKYLAAMPAWSHVEYLGVLAHGQIESEVLAKCKVGMVTLYPTPSYVESLPIKMFEYMLEGIPVVASNFKAWEEIVVKHNCGIMVDPTNSQEIAKACRYLIDNPAIAQEMGDRGRTAVLNNFSWYSQQQSLLCFYQEILQ